MQAINLLSHSPTAVPAADLLDSTKELYNKWAEWGDDLASILQERYNY